MTYIGMMTMMNLGRSLGYGLLALQGWESLQATHHH
jgi:hypothetical protein